MSGTNEQRSDLQRSGTVFCPNAGSVDYLDLFRDPTAWAPARAHVVGLKVYAGHLLDAENCRPNTWAALVDAGLGRCLREWGWALWIEMGSLKEFDLDGRLLLEQARQILPRALELGVPVVVAMDEPLTATVRGRFPITDVQLARTPEAIENQADLCAAWVTAVAREFAVEVGLIEAYPQHDAPEIASFATRILSRAPLAFLELDCDPIALAQDGHADLAAVTALALPVRAITWGMPRWQVRRRWWEFWRRNPSEGAEAYAVSQHAHLGLVRGLLGADVPLTVQSWARWPGDALQCPPNLPLSHPLAHTALLHSTRRD